jgi:hypothetical protein
LSKLLNTEGFIAVLYFNNEQYPLVGAVNLLFICDKITDRSLSSGTK